ncbi:hypothetical protein [Streptomyces werraensis]|uniref:hypothetical protein n=1 Tax=Streptomyces werraensis TaxID=68284 RepID=UPI003816A594
MSTEARRASLPPRPPHAPRTAGNPGPFDPRTPLDDTPSPQTDRPASDDTGRVVTQRTASDGTDSGAGGDAHPYRQSGTDRPEAPRPGPDAPGAGRGTPGPWDAGTATGDSTADDSTTTPRASADALDAGAARSERPHRPSGTGNRAGTVGTRRPAPDAWREGAPRGVAPAEPAHRPAAPAVPDARGTGAAERPYHPAGDGPTPAASDTRRAGAAPAEPTYRPTGDGTPVRPAAPPAPGGTPPRPASGERPRFPRIGADDRAAPPPPQASARFPDAPPTVGRAGSATPAVTPPAPSVPPRPAHRPRPDTPSETTTRLRAVPAEPDPALSWSAPMSPGGVPGAGRPASVSSGGPETGPRPFARRTRGQAVAAAVCLVLGTGLIGGAVTGAWLADGPEGPGTRHAFAVAGDLWHEVPVDQLFPPTVQGRGAGPGEADRVWTRIAVAPDSGCEGAFDALLTRVLAPVGCERLLRATYTDATQSHVTTVGLLFTEADAVGMEALARRFERERLDRRGDLMPLPYAAKDTAAEGFGPEQRASWAISVLTDAPVVVYAVSGWADGRSVDEPLPAEDAMRSGATTAPAQAGLGHEARGLADRFERALRKRAGTPTERPS